MQIISQDQIIVSSTIHTGVEFEIMETVCLVYQKNINYVPDYFSGLSRTIFCLFPTTFLEIAVYSSAHRFIRQILPCTHDMCFSL